MPTKVTDPSVLAQLNGGASATKQKVTDPALLSQLNGGTDNATPSNPAVSDTPPPGSIPGDRAYADWAAARARAGGNLPQVTNAPQTQYDFAIQKAQKDFGMSPQQTAGLKQQFDPSLWNLARAGTTMGLSDELSGLGGGLAGMLSGKDFGTGYGDFSNLQNKSLDLARENNGMLGSATELGSSILSMGPERAGVEQIVNGIKGAVGTAPGVVKSFASGAGTGGVLGGIGGFTSTEGDVGQRMAGAGKGTLAGMLLGTAGAAAGRLVGGALAGAPKGPAAADLEAQATNIYKAARKSGAKMAQSDTISLSDQMHDVAVNEGLISPTGRVSQAYPKISEALKTFDDYANGEMSVPQMQTIRRTLQDAAGSSDKGERRLGMAMLTKFDDQVAQTVPALAEAKPIYAQAMQAKMAEKLIRQGERSGNYPAPMAKAAAKIEDGKLRGYSDTSRLALEQAGKRSIPSTLIRGVGSKIGQIPAVNLLAWPATAAARGISNMMDRGAAEKAAAMVANGGVAPKGLNAQQLALANALLSTGARAGQLGQNGLPGMP